MISGPGAYLWMLGGAFSFSTMSMLSRLLSVDGSADWRWVALARAGLMLVFSITIVRAGGVPFPWRAGRTLWMRSLVGSLGMIGTFHTLTHLPISEAATLLNAYPVWIALLSWIVLGERPTAGVWGAVAVGLAGVVLIARPHFAEGGIDVAVAIGTSLCTAVVMLGLHRLAGVDPRAVVAHFAAAATSTFVILIAAGRVGIPRAMISDGRSALMLLGVGLLGTVGQYAMTRAFALADASRVSVVGLTQLAFGVMYDRLVWDRTFSSATLAGIALVAAPTAWLLAGRRVPGGSGSPPGSASEAAAP